MAKITLDILKAEEALLAAPEFKARGFAAWNTDIIAKQISVKYPEVLQDLRVFYPAKIERIQSLLASGGLDPDNVASLQAKIKRLQVKYACVLKELQFRDQKLVSRQPHDTTYYLDFNRSTGTLAGSWTWTNASASVTTGSGGDATKLAIGDYVRVSNGIQWYKVASIVNANSFTITPVFQQTTVTDGADVSKWSDISEANYGTTTALAIAHLNWYTTDTVRNTTTGDLLYVRANQTHVFAGVNIVHDEDGAAGFFQEVCGCSSTDDPWGDASDVKPILSFGTTVYNVYISADDFWKYNRLDFRASTNVNGIVYILGDFGAVVTDCNFQENTSATYGVGCMVQSAQAYFNNCTFSLNILYNFRMLGGRAHLNNCIFNGGGGASTDYGIYNGGGSIYLKNCQFGQTTLHDIRDLYAFYAGQIFHHNCIFAGSNLAASDGLIFAEDDNQVYQAHTIATNKGTISRDTAVIRTGGATSSAKMAPLSLCGVNNPLVLSPDYVVGGAFKIWMAAAAAKTVTVYIKGYGWSTFPTAAQLYAEASYYDAAAACTRTVLASTDVLVNNTDWKTFTMVIPATNPKRDGWVYVNVYLKLYTVSCGVNVDILVGAA